MHKHHRDEAYRAKQREATLAFFRTPEGIEQRKRLSRLRKKLWREQRPRMLAALKKAHFSSSRAKKGRTLEEEIAWRRRTRFSDRQREGRAAWNDRRYREGCHVYVLSIRGVRGRYKVGLALDMKDRFISLANALPTGMLTLRAYGFAKRRPGALELAAHREFGPPDGEWVKGGFERICAFLRERCEFGSFIVLKAPR